MDENGQTGEGSMAIAVDASVNTLLNDAHAWLRYAGGVTGLLVESLEDDGVGQAITCFSTPFASVFVEVMGGYALSEFGHLLPLLERTV
ncbi:hypothetical protein [Luteibacter sp. 9135]|uniref:hypothetical protein n=1 Tax=Luteibacter sp. 9135 TaxID=1500893 RepID=UPI000568998D|nr:hypothetical protein [Luteibacter sp. 9135]